jgi:hypothetical protein
MKSWASAIDAGIKASMAAGTGPNRWCGRSGPIIVADANALTRATHDRILALLGSPDRRDRIAAIGCRRKVAHVASIPARKPHR